MIRDNTQLHSFFEWVPLDYAGMFLGGSSLILPPVSEYLNNNFVYLAGSFLIVFLIFFLIVGKWMIPNIRLKWDQYDQQRFSFFSDAIDATSGNAKIDMKFDVPSHHQELYVVFDINGYTVGVDQYEDVNFDQEQAITCHSKISTFWLTLSLESTSGSSNRGATKQLVVRDNLHGKEIETITVET